MQQTNQFPSTCFRCGERVEAGEGVVDYATYEQRQAWPKHPDRKVLVQHQTCAEKFAGTFVHHIYNPEGKTDV